VLSCAGLVTSILYSFERFTMPAIVSIVWNAIIIVFIVALAPALPAHQRIYALVLGSVTGMAAQFALLVWAMRGLGFRVRLSARFDDPLLRRVLLLMVPVTISIGILNFNGLIDQAFAWLVSAAAPSQIYYAFRLFQLPQGIFAVTVAVVLFPSLARFAAQQDLTSFRETLTLGVRQIFFVCLPFVAWFLVIPQAIVRLIYQHGHFTAASTHQVAGALAMSALGLAFASGAMMFTRGFQSLQRPWLPLFVGVVNLALNAVLDWLLYKPLGVRGITLATSVTSIWAFFALVFLMRRHLGGLRLRAVVDGVARMVVCAALLAAVSYALWRALQGVADSGLGGLLGAVVVAFAGGGVVYVAAARLLRVEELAMVRRLLRRRGGGAGGAQGPGEGPLAPLPPDATPLGPAV
jgi:putative peptidoglycan lipid II flippase